MKMKKLSLPICALLTVIILSIPWLVKGSGILLLFAFIPLFYIEKQLSSLNKSFKIWRIGALIFLAWNISTLWWLYCVNEDITTKLTASLLPIIINSLLMSLPLILFHLTKKRFGDNIGYLSFVCYLIAF